MTMDNHAACYAAFQSKDSRFDGHFFVGVTSTGIYCRPVCRARLPRPENCTFFKTAAEAERAGFRPCLLCRPELAPGCAPMVPAARLQTRSAAPQTGTSRAPMVPATRLQTRSAAPKTAPGCAPVDASRRLAVLAAKRLEEYCGSIESLEELAASLGCTARHLRRVFREEYRVSPVQYLQTCRLLLAKSLLTDTGLSVLEVAMASGFGSLRRFNDLFRARYHLSPTSLRRQTGQADRPEGQNISLMLGYRPPYDWERLLAFLAPRAIPGVEIVRDSAYYRTVRLVRRDGTNVCGWIRAENVSAQNALRVTVSAPLLAVLPQVLARVRELFDLNCDPNRINETLQAMETLKPGLCVPGVRVPGCFDPFEMAVRTILGQQITVKGATTLAGRVARELGTPVRTEVEGLTHVFPTARDICGLEEPVSGRLGAMGIIAARANTISTLAGKLADGSIRLSVGADPEQTAAQLMELPGIGAWTAGYMAMRASGWTDAFLETDHGIKKALAPRKAGEIRELAERWRPWRSYAMMNLWNSL